MRQTITCKPSVCMCACACAYVCVHSIGSVSLENPDEYSMTTETFRNDDAEGCQVDLNSTFVTVFSHFPILCPTINHCMFLMPLKSVSGIRIIPPKMCLAINLEFNIYAFLMEFLCK